MAALSPSPAAPLGDQATPTTLAIRLYVSLVEARAWVEHTVAPLRPLSPAAAEPGEKLLRQIDADLAAARVQFDFATDQLTASQRLDDMLAEVRSPIAGDDALSGGRS